MPGARAQVPPDLGGVVAQACLLEDPQRLAPVAEAVERLRHPGARQVAEDDRPKRLDAGIPPLPERRGRAQRQQVGQEIRRLVHQVDAQILILDARMDVHAADHHAPGEGLVLVGEDAVALEVDRRLLGPARPRVGGGRDHAKAELARTSRDRGSKVRQFLVRFADRGADRGADLDLRLQELVGHLRSQRLFATPHEAGRRPACKSPGLGIDEQVFLLDAQSQSRLA